MNVTGITRTVDDLGRVIIPKEIRDRLRITYGSTLEIFIENNAVCFRKYVPDYSSSIEDIVGAIKGDIDFRKNGDKYLPIIESLQRIAEELKKAEEEK